MTRIIAGTAKGRPLKVPSAGTRPTSDRVRESVFSSLEHVIDDWHGLAVLDLYAGSGAFALEALSRGARTATLVERARPAAVVARENVTSTGLAAHVENRSVAAFLRSTRKEPFDLVFADPPYAVETAEVEEMLNHLCSEDWLCDCAIVLVERPTRMPPIVWPDGFAEPSTRRFGETLIYRSIWYVS